jgi:hypothetical protein
VRCNHFTLSFEYSADARSAPSCFACQEE